MIVTPEYLARSGTEHGHQAAVFCWAAQNMPSYPCLAWMHAIPNGGQRSKSQASRLKVEGVKSGVADIFLPVLRGNCAGLYIEMKREDGMPSDVSEDQLAFGAFVTMQGYGWTVAFGWEDAIRILIGYLNQQTLAVSDKQFKVYGKINDLREKWRHGR